MLFGWPYKNFPALQGIVWTDKHMWWYFEDPKKYVPGTKMAFCGREVFRGNAIGKAIG